MFLKRIPVTLLLVLFCSSGFASSLCVKARDYAELPLPGARVIAVNLQTNKLSSAQTDSNGKACISALAEGLYSVEVGLTGFLNVRYYPVRVAYPVAQNLHFRLPFGEITEGGIGQDVTISGTLLHNGAPVGGAEICVFSPDGTSPLTCGLTTELGEYALSFRPGTYDVDVKAAGVTHRSRIDVLAPGVYRNLLAIEPLKRNQQR
jgi:hypothetical protein